MWTFFVKNLVMSNNQCSINSSNSSILHASMLQYIPTWRNGNNHSMHEGIYYKILGVTWFLNMVGEVLDVCLLPGSNLSSALFVNSLLQHCNNMSIIQNIFSGLIQHQVNKLTTIPKDFSKNWIALEHQAFAFSIHLYQRETLFL